MLMGELPRFGTCERGLVHTTLQRSNGTIQFAFQDDDLFVQLQMRSV